MILIGQFDSPFVRRVAIALDLYGIAFEHRPWSTFGDAELLARLNPRKRQPDCAESGVGCVRWVWDGVHRQGSRASTWRMG